jgi:hypothetical protein
MRRAPLLVLFLVAVGCFEASDGDTAADEATSDQATETTDESCLVGSEACPCTAGGSCDAGLVCLSDVCVDPSAESSSEESTTQTETTDTETTDTETTDTDSTETGEELVPCDPLLQDCPQGELCAWSGDIFGCLDSTRQIPSGEPCDAVNDCAAGNFCADAAALPACNGAACCAPFCDLTDPICSIAGTECVAFFEEGMAPPGHEDVGVCILPF